MSSWEFLQIGPSKYMFRIVCLLFEHPDVNTLNILLKPMRHDLCPTLFLQISQRGFASFTLLLYLFVFPLLLPVFKSRYSTKMSRHCISLYLVSNFPVLLGTAMADYIVLLLVLRLLLFRFGINNEGVLFILLWVSQDTLHYSSGFEKWWL